MANVLIKQEPSHESNISRMRRDAQFDVADGISINGQCAPDLSFLAADGRPNPPPPKVPKVFLSNDCRFNCAYCGCRCSRDINGRYCMQPRQIARIAVEESREQNRGIFLTSAIYKSADYTQELIAEAVRLMRQEFHYYGYIHAKVMPGADPKLIARTGRYANRLSVNIEVAQSEGYARIAKQKNKSNILTPMGQISDMIHSGADDRSRFRPRFASSQTTQLMAGSVGETDRTILTLSKALYKRYSLSRVYYTAFQYLHPAKGYDIPPVSVPPWRMARLYQADRLIALYGFTPEEIAPDDAPDLDETIDPKLRWALRNMHLFPVEVNTADFETLIRVPGIGVLSAQRILKARHYCALTHDILKQIGVRLKKSRYFITCSGRFMGGMIADRPETLGALLEGGIQTSLLEKSGLSVEC